MGFLWCQSQEVRLHSQRREEDAPVVTHFKFPDRLAVRRQCLLDSYISFPLGQGVNRRGDGAIAVSA